VRPIQKTEFKKKPSVPRRLGVVAIACVWRQTEAASPLQLWLTKNTINSFVIFVVQGRVMAQGFFTS
jgi:hypothetical protein